MRGVSSKTSSVSFESSAREPKMRSKIGRRLNPGRPDPELRSLRWSRPASICVSLLRTLITVSAVRVPIWYATSPVDVVIVSVTFDTSMRSFTCTSSGLAITGATSSVRPTS